MAASAALVGGCGSDDEERSPRGEPQTQTQARPAISDQTQIREVASRFLEAYAKGDWKGVCATLSPKARARFARKAGSCPALYRETARRDKTDKSLLVSRVRLKGENRAIANVSFGGSQEGRQAFKLYAAKIEGKWFLYIKRAAKGAPA